MELSGDEKRIQALFSELSFENRSRTPRFEKLWGRAEIHARVPAPFVRRSVPVIVAVVIVAAVGLLAGRSWHRASGSENAVNIPAQIIPSTSQPRVTELLSADSKNLRTVRPRRLVRQRQNERAAIREAEMLSNWQSPTNILLNAPTASVLSSLPQFNQSAQALEQFLPKNNEVIKESNQ